MIREEDKPAWRRFWLLFSQLAIRAGVANEQTRHSFTDLLPADLRRYLDSVDYQNSARYGGVQWLVIITGHRPLTAAQFSQGCSLSIGKAPGQHQQINAAAFTFIAGLSALTQPLCWLKFI